MPSRWTTGGASASTPRIFGGFGDRVRAAPGLPGPPTRGAVHDLIDPGVERIESADV